MSLEVKVNLNSLRIVREELFATIEQAATDFEAFMLDQAEGAALTACVEKMAQVAGAMRLLEYPGAALLADEMGAMARLLKSADRAPTKSQVDALTHGLFVLPRYLEYLSSRQAALPILLIPYINELRIARREPLYPESYFCDKFSFDLARIPKVEKAPGAEQLSTAAKRLLLMYQTGLLGVLKGNKLKPHILLMSRAVTRLSGMLGKDANTAEWTLVEVVLECFSNGSLELTFNRKRLLADIEKSIRELTNGVSVAGFSGRENYHRELSFALLMAPEKSPRAKTISDVMGLHALPLSDRDIAAQRVIMHGPSTDTIESVIKVLHEELRAAKDVLEVAAQNNTIDTDDLINLITILRRVSDTLSVLNLTGPQATLVEQQEKVAGWENNNNVRTLEFLEVADAVLFVESSLNGLDRKEISVAELNEASVLTRKRVIASSHLAEAERVVIVEAESGIALAKRAITAYVDSNYDAAHIANLATTLNSVRGGLQVLGYQRAADVLNNCGAFISAHMKQTNAKDQRHQLLETLADALISLEYYLGEVAVSRDVNEKILEVAEESLAALGFGSVASQA